VVLKQIATEVGAGARAVFACLRELASPHLPAVEEVVDDDDGRTWLVTRYVEGQALERGPAELVQVLDEAIGTAHALAALHSAGTHHADISPGNVLVDGAGRSVLTDLGSLGAIGFGTPGFVAPECLRGGGGPASDLFGLACVMFWRLTGRSPWPDTQALTRLKTQADVRRQTQALYGLAREEVPKSLRSLLERMLHPDPRRRVGDAKVVLRVLRQIRARVSDKGERFDITTWWVPARWPFFGPLRERIDELAGRLARGEGPRLVLVHGPPGSGRGRVVEELVASLQLGGFAARAEDAVAFDRSSNTSAKEAAPGQWLEAWLSTDVKARLRACRERVRWPPRLQSDGEADRDLVGLRSAMLLAGARLGQGTRVLVVSEALAHAVAASGLSEVEVLALGPASRASCEALLEEVIEGPRRDAWIEAIYERTGGWPAQLVSWVEAAAAQGAQDPNHELDALDVGGTGVDMSEEEARALLARSWGFPMGLPQRWTEVDASAPWVLDAAQKCLGEELGAWAHELAGGLPEGRAPSMVHALALGDFEVLSTQLRTRVEAGDWFPAPLLRWACEHVARLDIGSVRVAAEQLLSAGRNEEALALTRERERALAVQRARALQRLGRAAEALELLRGRAEGDDELRGLGWRALVDLGRGDEAADEVRAWWSGRGEGRAASMDLASCTAALWGALVLMADEPALSAEMLRAVESALGGRRDRRSVSSYARARQLSGNLAHLEGRPADVRRAYADARDAFEAAGEASAAVWLDGSLCALAVPAGELGLALTHGRRALRTLLARAELQALPGAVWNLVEALVRVDGLDEAGSMIDAAARVCRAAQVGRGELLLLDACGAQVHLARAARDDDREGLARAASELAELAARLQETGHAREACASWLHDAAVRRVLGQPAASKHSREKARVGAEAADDGALLLECALESLDYVRAFKTGPAWGGSLESAAAELSTHEGPGALRKRGQLELAFRYDRSLYRALYRLHGPHHPACRALRRRAFESLELMMSKTDTTDRAALRSTALNDHGDRGALSELLQGLVEDAQEGATTAVVPATPPSQSVVTREQRASLLLRMYRRLAREDDLERLLAQVCDVMMELTDGERGVVVVTTGDERHEVLREFSNENDAPSFSRSVIERVLSTGDPVLSVDATQDARFDGAHSISHLNLRLGRLGPLELSWGTLGGSLRRPPSAPRCLRRRRLELDGGLCRPGGPRGRADAGSDGSSPARRRPGEEPRGARGAARRARCRGHRSARAGPPRPRRA
jgi:tetratricopeptide (TPR) repeat protein